MEKTPFIVSVRYREVTQPQQYHSQEAEVSSQYAIAEDTDAEKAIASGLDMVKRQVRIALGKETGTLTAVATDPAKRGPGRPPKKDPPAGEPDKAQIEAETMKLKEAALKAKEEPKSEVEAAAKENPAPSEQSSADDDFGDSSEPVKEITDAEVQAACREAVAKSGGVVVAADVKNLARLKYGTDKVVAIKQGERAGFLADLKNLVAEKSKK